MDQVALFERPGGALTRGVLIAVERGGPENAAPEGARVAGIRSFGIIGLLGGLWAQLASQVGAVVHAQSLGSQALETHRLQQIQDRRGWEVGGYPASHVA